MGFPITPRQKLVLDFVRDEHKAGRTPVLSATIAKAVGIGADQVVHSCASLIDKRLIKGEQVTVNGRRRYVWEPVVS